MEGQSDSSNSTKRLIIILPLLLTHFATKATNDNPTYSSNKELTISAIPIIANTLATYNNLKTAQDAQTKVVDASVVDNAASAALIVSATTEIKAIQTAEKEVENAEVKTEKISAGAESAMATMTNASFSVSTLNRDERRQFIAYFAESHTDWGFHYRYGGTSIDKGIDCSGFTRYVLEYFDIKAPRTSREQFEAGEKIPVEMAKRGDLVFFGSKKSITHVALVVENGEEGLIVVHSCNRGIIKENISKSSYWRPKLKSTAVNIFDNQIR